jgi:hypothetical protein
MPSPERAVATAEAAGYLRCMPWDGSQILDEQKEERLAAFEVAGPRRPSREPFARDNRKSILRRRRQHLSTQHEAPLRVCGDWPLRGCGTVRRTRTAPAKAIRTDYELNRLPCSAIRNSRAFFPADQDSILVSHAAY